MYELLEKINDPSELRALDRKQLPQVAEELREFLLNSVAHTGGHLSSNLGTVELTVALHYVFQTPEDRLVWDVGHQTYAHKILTGRRERMSTLRQYGGISGFPRRNESPFDTFGTAHSSTSISAALGMAVASRLKGEERRVVAIIGDGAMTAGMAFEALNNAGAMDTNLLVVLNDNDMSISENVGALNNYLAKLMSGRFYAAARKTSERVLGVMPPVLELAKRAEEHVKGMVTPSTLFEEFGFNYIGPIDGHDTDALVATLANIKKLRGPQFLHVVTKKGKGYAPAEEDPILYHGPGKFDPAIGIVAKPSTKPTYSQIFGDWLCEKSKLDRRLIRPMQILEHDGQRCDRGPTGHRQGRPARCEGACVRSAHARRTAECRSAFTCRAPDAGPEGTDGAAQGHEGHRCPLQALSQEQGRRSPATVPRALRGQGQAEHG
mgnify:CR=1 FL=1